MSGDLAKVIGLDDGQPLLLSISAEKHGRNLALRCISLGLPHPFFGLDLLAAFDLTVEGEIPTYHITRTALWVTGVLLGAPRFLPSLLAQVGCELSLASRTFSSAIYCHKSST